MAVLQIDHLTKDYGNNRGVFDISFAIGQGEIFGFLGPNGSGKTVTIRHLLGFTRPQSGTASINGLDCWKNSSAVKREIQRQIGYLPGDINFPNDMTGTQFIQFLAEMRGLKDTQRMKQLKQRFDLDTAGELKRMSRGMKQKIAIIGAFMHNPAILILDEPTNGLDPLMRANFLDLLREEKKENKTILMSSHLFDEVENACDRVGMIKHGKMVAIVATGDIKHAQRKTFKIEFLNPADYESMTREPFNIKELKPENCQIVVDVEDTRINSLFAALSQRKVKFISEIKHDLEEYFMGRYKEKENHVQ
jgi:ABC-2 type transport system ATP-binding protein